MSDLQKPQIKDLPINNLTNKVINQLTNLDEN